MGKLIDPLFNAVTNADGTPKTGGNKEVTLTRNQMPSHDHGGGAHNHNSDAHRHMQFTTVSSPSGTYKRIDYSGEGNATEYEQTFSQWSDVYIHWTGAIIASNGSDAAHPNIQPFIVCYFYKRLT